MTDASDKLNASCGGDTFTLHPRLAADSHWVTDLPLCRVLLSNDSQYLWLILVPRQSSGAPELRELVELDWSQQLQYLRESNLVSQVLQQAFQAHKLNIAALGNMVPQLHIHHVARYQEDIAWPAPIWGFAAAKPYEAQALEALLAQLRKHIVMEKDAVV